MTNQPNNQQVNHPPPPSISCSLAIEGRRGEAAFQSASCSSQLAQSPSHQRDAPGAKMSKDPPPRPAPPNTPNCPRAGPPCINAKPHVAVHLRLLRPFRHPPYVPQALLLALAGEHFWKKKLNPTDFYHRIRTLCWCTTSTSPTRTTTRCWSPTPCPCGARRRSGPRRNSSPSWSQCVSIETQILLIWLKTFSYFYQAQFFFLGKGSRKTYRVSKKNWVLPNWAFADPASG